MATWHDLTADAQYRKRIRELEAALRKIAEGGDHNRAWHIAQDALKGADPDVVPVRATPVDEKGDEAK